MRMKELLDRLEKAKIKCPCGKYCVQEGRNEGLQEAKDIVESLTPEPASKKSWGEYMKKVEIKQFTHAEVDAPKEMFGALKIPIEHKLIRAEGENLEVSDGYHTMDELYEHRITLFIALCRNLFIFAFSSYAKVKYPIWRSKLHSDGSSFEGWFILGINKEKGTQITYHLPISKWGETESFAETLDKAPEWDGHTSADVLERLKEL